MLAIFAVFNVLLYFSYAYLFLWEEVHLSPIKPLYWYLFTIISGILLIVLSRGLRLPDRASQKLIAWAVIFLAVASVSFIFSQHVPALEILIKYAEAMSLLVIFVILFQDKRVARYAAMAMLVVVLASVVINYIDFVLGSATPFSNVPGRAAGMYVNSNISGSALIFGMVLSVHVLPKRFRWFYCLFVGTGIVLTFSRSSIMGWTIAMIALSWKNTFVLRRAPSIAIVTTLVIIMSVMLVMGAWVGLFKAAGVGNYLDRNAQARISGSFFGQSDYSSMSRKYVAERAFQMFLEAPLLGHGLGATETVEYGVSAHNMYLRLGVDMGIVGVLMLLVFLWLLWRANTNVSGIIAVVYAFTGLFTHNYFEQPALQLVIALTIAGTEIVKEKHATQPTVLHRHRPVMDVHSPPAA
jgi:O-antigen ligase